MGWHKNLVHQQLHLRIFLRLGGGGTPSAVVADLAVVVEVAVSRGDRRLGDAVEEVVVVAAGRAGVAAGAKKPSRHRGRRWRLRLRFQGPFFGASGHREFLLNFSHV